MSNPATDDQTISVIYVDDEPSLLEIGRLFLQKTGTFTVTTAESADEAIQTLQKQSFNAIISDYQMPGMDGIAFLKYLRTAGDTTPFIIFTGKGREDVVIEALNEGADFYLQKGGDPKSQFAELSNKVRYAVTRRQAEEALLLKNEELSAAEEELRSQLDETIAVQHQLALSEQQYRAIFEHTEAPTVIIEEDTTISLANSAFATISGYSMQEVNGRSWAEFVIKQDLDRMMVYHRERREEGVEPRTQYDFTFINRYGDPSTIHLTIGMIPGTRQSVASFHDITEMKLAESALKMSEIRYRRLFEAAQDGILILDEDDGAIIDANPFVLKMLGYCLDELLGRRLPEIGFIRDKILAEEAFLRLKGEGYIRYEDLPLETKDGRLMEVEFISNRYAINDHSVIQCNIRDVTERKRAESEILEAQRLLGGMLDGIPDIVGLQHPDHTMVRYNKAGYELLGLTPEEVEGRRCYELIGRSTPCENCATALAIASKKQETVVRYTPEFGMYLECTSNPILDENGEIEMIIERLHDITDQKKAEEALRESEERYRTLFEEAVNPILVVNEAGYYIDANNAACAFLECTREELFTKSVWDFALPEKLERQKKEHSPFMAPRTIETDYLIHGTIKTLLLNVVPLEVEGKTILYGIGQDITERKAAEEALQTASKKLHLLSSITRHDILNQVMALQGYLDLIQHEINDPTLSRYHTEAEKAANAIQKQIEFTRVYENLGVHAPTWQPLSPLIEVIDHTHPPIHHDCGEVSVYADPMFEKVLQNLYDNTLRYAGGADCVMIRCEEQDGSLVITWEDNGPGVPDNVKERIFEKGVGKNTGLGLFLAREILSITGITISESGVYGEGARFEIMVPGSVWRRDGEGTG